MTAAVAAERSKRAAGPARPDDIEGILEVSMLRAVGNVRIALIVLVLIIITASPGIIASRPAAYLGLFVGTLLTIWTRFGADWSKLQTTNRLSSAAAIVLFGDVTWTALFILGTGGLMSPFLAFLFIPLLFGSAFFSVLNLAAALLAALITLIIAGFGLAVEQTLENIWRTFGTIFATIAVAWVAYALALVLERERRTNQLVVRHMTEAVVLIDGGGVIRLANPPLGEVTGLDHHALLGMHVDELPAGRGSSLLREIVGDITSAGGPANTIRDIQTTGEKPCDLRIYTARMGGAGRSSGWLIIAQDITDLKSVARARETGVRFLSHEMRSPLSTLKIISQIFGELTGQLTDSNAERLVTILDTETDRMLRMVGQFLDLAALDQGTFHLALQPLDASAIMHRVGEALEVRTAEKGLHIVNEVPASLPLVNADPDRLEDVLHNLCDNALKYTHSGGTIRLSAASSGGTVRLCVCDNGMGIAPEIQDDIFSEFVRAAEDGKSGRKMGVGLGLYMARRIVEEHGGTITVQSTPGEGSDFTISLPAA